MALEFRILGPLEVERGATLLALKGSKQRALLTYLLLHANELVSRRELISALWSKPPKSAGKLVQIYVLGLRKLLESNGDAAATILTERAGYRLSLDTARLDLNRFNALVDEARDAMRRDLSETAAEGLRDALALWRGPALAEVEGHPFAAAAVERLEDLRLSAIEDRVDADLVLGRHPSLLGELELLVERHPLRERLRAQLMVVLYRSGRQAEALKLYREYRRHLVEELGLEPSPELRQLERAILTQDRSLERGTGRDRPSAAATTGPSNLPAFATALVGRHGELETLGRLLRRSDVRLVTLTGVPAVGKTLLALELASGLGTEFPDGIFLVELAAVTEAELVPAAIARSLQLQTGKGDRLEELLVEFVRERRALLVVDNFEHVLAAAPFVSKLLSAAPGLKVLLTSRASLDLAGEREFPLSPLAVPVPSEHDRDQLLRFPAVALFVERAQAVRPDLDLGDGSLVTIAEVCRRLDGLPLSIEVAAARLKVLPPAGLLDLLGRRLDVLESHSRDAVPRHQTLRTTIDWSYRLLSPDDQRLFRCLSVFAGGFGLEAAEAVCGGEVRTGLESLVASSLLRAEGDVEPRFSMLETLREYAAERLHESEEEAEARLRHAGWCADLAKRAENAMGQAAEAPWLERLELEHDNIGAALSYVIDTGDATTALELSSALRRFWHIHGHLAEGRRWLDASLALDGEAAPVARTQALGASGVLAALQGDTDTARSFFEASIALARKIGADHRVATELANLGMLEVDECEYECAEEHLGEALALRQKLGRRTASILDSLGLLALTRGDLDRALALVSEAEEESRELGDAPARGAALRSLGRILIFRGEEARAEEVLAESLRLGQSLAWRQLIAECFDVLALLAAKRHDPARAATLLGCADEAREAIDARRLGDEHRWYRDVVAELTADLGADEFAAHYAEGRALPAEDAVETALERVGAIAAR